VWKDATKRSLIWELLKARKFIATFYTHPLGKTKGSGEKEKKIMKEFFLIMKEEKICVVILHLKVHVSIAKKWGMSLQNAKCKKKKTN